MTGSVPLLEARSLAVSYGVRVALQPTDIAIAPAESIAVVGRNGSGKSSLLRALCGLEPAARGEVILHAERCHHRRTNVEIAYVPQRSAARWDLPFAVADIVAAGRLRRWWRRPSLTDRAAIHAALGAVGMAAMASRTVNTLSGGQAQRVLLARALIQQPDIMIMDEPLTGLDVESVDVMVRLMARLVDEGTAVCCALHEIDIARTAFTRTVAMFDGSVVADGYSGDVLDPDCIQRIFTRRAAS
ncbi:MAG: metal ABC transporter ATP-binding protein [Actinomycetia bacterium]|nr:metal ABC transporter ATP-binding protein [Actinomycetes bacterium]MCH9760769.1 metal ABC transporter ATP-binding protein [Actinomycetes bacterium]